MHCRGASINQGEEESQGDEFCDAERCGVKQQVGCSAERARDGERAETTEIRVCQAQLLHPYLGRPRLRVPGSRGHAHPEWSPRAPRSTPDPGRSEICRNPTMN